MGERVELVGLELPSEAGQSLLPTSGQFDDPSNDPTSIQDPHWNRAARG